MPISDKFRTSALKHTKTPKGQPKPSDADLYWQTVCDLGAYLRIKFLDHFNPGNTGNLADLKLAFPKVSITLGSGLGAFADTLKDPLVLPYKNLPGFEFLSKSAVPGHKKCIVAGRMNDGTPVVALSGRIHAYELNNNVDESALLTAAILDAGINNIILTNAAGSLDPDYGPGSVMLGTSIAKETVPNFGTGLAHPYAGSLFYPMHCVSTEFHRDLEALARELGVKTFQGTYVQYPGRRYETPGEIARLATERQLMLQGRWPELAVGAVGMSTGHEVEAVCQHATREQYSDLENHPLPRVVILSAITNLGAGLSKTPPNHKEVEAEGVKLAPNFVAMCQKLTTLLHNSSQI